MTLHWSYFFQHPYNHQKLDIEGIKSRPSSSDEFLTTALTLFHYREKKELLEYCKTHVRWLYSLRGSRREDLIARVLESTVQTNRETALANMHLSIQGLEQFDVNDVFVPWFYQFAAFVYLDHFQDLGQSYVWFKKCTEYKQYPLYQSIGTYGMAFVLYMHQDKEGALQMFRESYALYINSNEKSDYWKGAITRAIADCAWLCELYDLSKTMYKVAYISGQNTSEKIERLSLLGLCFHDSHSEDWDRVYTTSSLLLNDIHPEKEAMSFILAASLNYKSCIHQGIASTWNIDHIECLIEKQNGRSNLWISQAYQWLADGAILASDWKVACTLLTRKKDYDLNLFRCILRSRETELHWKYSNAIKDLEIERLQKAYSEQQIEQYNLEQQALYDSLTNAPNRRLFDKTLVQWSNDSRDWLFAILDIDFFKKVNDSHGHKQGDSALVLFYQALRAADTQFNTFSARTGGEEWSMLLPSNVIPTDVFVFIRDFLERAYEDNHYSYGMLKFSMGYAKYNGCSERVMLHADEALYKAKRTGRDKCVFYNDISGSKQCDSGSKI